MADPGLVFRTQPPHKTAKVNLETKHFLTFVSVDTYISAASWGLSAALQLRTNIMCPIDKTKNSLSSFTFTTLRCTWATRRRTAENTCYQQCSYHLHVASLEIQTNLVPPDEILLSCEIALRNCDACKQLTWTRQWLMVRWILFDYHHGDPLSRFSSHHVGILHTLWTGVCLDKMTSRWPLLVMRFTHGVLRTVISR